VRNTSWHEALNALWQSGCFDDEELTLVARALYKYGFDVLEPRGITIERAAAPSVKEGISVYDASH